MAAEGYHKDNEPGHREVPEEKRPRPPCPVTPPFYGRGEGTLALETLRYRRRLQGFRRRNEEKTFTLGSGPQAMIQADKGLTARLPLDPHERRGQLQPIRCP